ncbi:tetratricopeptide repeat protein [Ectobacillus panaciterrae]|uniref:tetratricopeptide repeat protein n=1 Tax=Ectobacillus panaciterrae TaxID=363872 RepID=UPI000417A901|nr:tetratricopeptide repeat protein [Ectobacillus panaciterrae]
MSFQPQVDDQITLFDRTYKTAKHPAVIGIDIPYGQEGRQGIVYQLYSDSVPKAALKIFRSRFREVESSKTSSHYEEYKNFPGLKVCERLILTKTNHRELISRYEDLSQAVLMPWIDGPTWADILLEHQVLTKEQCLSLAGSLGYLLLKLEEQELAHCDLSASNLILPYLEDQASSYPIELVDIEQMYSSNAEQPAALPGGTKGYAPAYLKEGIWTPYGDRFSGAVLLAELLGWVDESVRIAKANDMSYFDEIDIQEDSERYRTLLGALEENWGNELADLLQRAWNSNSLEECPSFREWWEALPEAAQQESKQRYEECAAQSQAQLPEEQTALSAEERMKAADLLEQAGNVEAALREYQYMHAQPRFAALHQDIKGIIGNLEARIGQVNSSFQLQDYTEAAVVYEQTDEFEKAVFLYEYAQKLYAADAAAVQELAIITGQVKEMQRQKEKTSKIQAFETAKQKAEKPRYIQRAERPSPFARKEEQKPKPYKKWLIGMGIGIGAVAVLYFSYYGIMEYRYKSNIAEGDSAYKQKDYIKAEGKFEKAAGIKETEEAYIKLATTYVMREQYQKTIEYLTDLTAKGKISKKSSLASYFIGRAWFSLKNYEQALVSYKKALDSKDGKLGEYQNLALRDLAVSYGQMGQSQKARDVLNMINQTDNASVAFVNAIDGDLASIDKNYGQAIEKYKIASEKDPDTTRYKQLLGRAYIWANRTETDAGKKEAQYTDAINILASIRSTDPNNAVVLGDLASAYSEAGGFYEVQNKKDKSDGMYNEAIKLYEKIRQTGYSNDNLELNLAVLNGKIDKIEEAKSGFKKVLDAKPNDGHAQLLYGTFLIDQKQYEEAHEALMKAEQNDTDPAERELAKDKKQELEVKNLVK